jgi:hypothetical protein
VVFSSGKIPNCNKQTINCRQLRTDGMVYRNAAFLQQWSITHRAMLYRNAAFLQQWSVTHRAMLYRNAAFLQQWSVTHRAMLYLNAAFLQQWRKQFFSFYSSTVLTLGSSGHPNGNNYTTRLPNCRCCFCCWIFPPAQRSSAWQAVNTPNFKDSQLRGCIQKLSDWVDKDINKNNNKHLLRSNTMGYGGKTH